MRGEMTRKRDGGDKNARKVENLKSKSLIKKRQDCIFSVNRLKMK